MVREKVSLTFFVSANVNELDVAEEGRERWYAVDQRALAGLIENPADLTIERE
jgi:hypothetical protein